MVQRHSVATMIEAYVINLDRCADRLAWFAAGARRADLAFSRIPAIDAMALPAAELQRQIGPEAACDRWEVAKLGCFLSHRAGWQRAAEAPSGWAAIFEDDVHLGPGLDRLLASTAWLPPDADLVKLETTGLASEIGLLSRGAPAGRRLHRLRGFHMGAGGYLLAAAAARRLLASPEGTFTGEGADHVLFNADVGFARSLRIYQLAPAICIQEKFLALRERRLPRFASEIVRTGLSKPWPKAPKWQRELTRLARRTRAVALGLNPWAKVAFTPGE